MRINLKGLLSAIAEAGWLLALAVTPVYFSLFTTRQFEPDKLRLLMLLVCLSAVLALPVWLAGMVTASAQQKPGAAKPAAVGSPVTRFLKRWWRALALGGVAVWILLVSGALALNSLVSLFGGNEREEGALTLLTYLALFALTALHARSERQKRRMILAIELGSLPVCLYAIAQAAQLDPTPWAFAFSWRAFSTFGQPLYLGGYTAMLLPLTLVLLLEAFRARPTGERGSLLSRITLAAILLLQLTALILSGTRGAWLGALAGAGFVFLFVVWPRLTALYRRLTIGALVVIFLGMAALVRFGLPASLTESAPVLERIASLLEARSGSGRERLLVWQSAQAAAWFHAPVLDADGRADPLNTLRPWLGYGPESLATIYPRFQSPELVRAGNLGIADRAHNVSYDTWVSFGLVGLAPYWGLIFLLAFAGYRALGLIVTRRDRLTFTLLAVGGGLGGYLLGWLLLGGSYPGLGVPLGMIGGIAGYLLLPESGLSRTRPGLARGDRALRSPPHPANDNPGGRPSVAASSQWIILALAAAMTHLVEAQFGIPFTATRALFVCFAALLFAPPAALGDSRVERPASAARGARKEAGSPPGYLPELVLLSAVMAVSGLNYLGQLTQGADWLELLLNGLSKSRESAPLLLPVPFLILLLTWLVGALAIPSLLGQAPNHGWLRWLWRSLTITFGFSLALWVVWTANIAMAGAASTPALRADKLAGLAALTFLNAIILLAGVGAALTFTEAEESRSDAGGRSRTERRSYVLYAGAVMGLVAAWVVGGWLLHRAQADTLARFGDDLQKSGQIDPAVVMYQRAIKLDAGQSRAFDRLSSGYLALADRAANAGEDGTQAWEHARDALLRAAALEPFLTDYQLKLARMYRWEALGAPTEEAQMQAAQEADRFARRAIALSPVSSLLWREAADIAYEVSGDLELALERANQALTLTPSDSDSHLLRMQILLALSARDQSGDYLAQAMQDARPAIGNQKSILPVLQVIAGNPVPPDLVDAFISSAGECKTHGKQDEWFCRVIRSALYAASARLDLARAEAASAASVAPPSKADDFQKWQEALGGS